MRTYQKSIIYQRLKEQAQQSNIPNKEQYLKDLEELWHDTRTYHWITEDTCSEILESRNGR